MNFFFWKKQGLNLHSPDFTFPSLPIAGEHVASERTEDHRPIRAAAMTRARAHGPAPQQVTTAEFLAPECRGSRENQTVGGFSYPTQPNPTQDHGPWHVRFHSTTPTTPRFRTGCLFLLSTVQLTATFRAAGSPAAFGWLILRTYY